MSVKPALTASELIALAGPTVLRRFLKAVPAIAVATARINQTVFGYPLAQLTVDTTSAGWSNVRAGMTLYIGSSAGAHDRGIYRVRKTPGATTLYIGEMGTGDPGLLPVDLYSTLITDNDYATIYDRYDVWSVLPRIAYPSSSTIYEDYDLAVGTNNTYPSPIVNMTINGQTGHFGKFITAASQALTCVVSCTQWVSQTYTYAWSYPASWTSVSGATTATLTGTAAPGDYTVSCTATPNVGDAITITRHIFICDATTNPPIYIAEMPQSDTRDRTGRRMTFSLYDNKLASIPDGAMVHYWEECTWNGTTVDTATTCFSGWLLRQTRNTAPGQRDAQIEVVGPAGLLGLLQSTSQVITASATADTWQKVVPALSSASFLAWYMLTCRAANILKLFNFTVFSTSATGQCLPEWRLDKGTLLQQIQALATARGNFGANSAGELFFLRHPSLVDYSSRTAGVVQRDTLTSDLYSSAQIEERRYKLCQQVRGEAFAWDGSAVEPTPYLSDAPVVPSQGGAMQKLSEQVVDSQDTLNQLTGDQWAALNNPFPSVSVEIRKNRDVYEPAELPFVTVTVPAALSPDGIQWSKRCIPLSVNKRHYAGGAADITLSLEAETHGMAGITVPVPVANTNLVTPDVGYPEFDTPITDLYFPPVTPEPPVIAEPGSGDIRTDGSFAFGCTATKVYRTFNFKDATPTYEDITPSGFADFKMVLFDPATDHSRAGYVLGNDGTDSMVAYCADLGAETPSWTTGATVSGVYTLIVALKGQPGRIAIYTPSTTWTASSALVTFDLGGFSYSVNAGTVASGGNPGNCLDGGAAVNVTDARAEIDLGTTVTITNAKLDWNKITDPTGNMGRFASFYDGSHSSISSLSVYSIESTGVWRTTDFGALNVAGVRYIEFGVGASGSPLVLHGQMDNCYVAYSFASATDALVTASTDYGVTVGTPQLVGTALAGTGGFDGTRYGNATVAAADNQAKRATALGGAYSAIAGLTESAVSILIPWWQIGSNANANNSLTAPDFLMGGSFGLDKVIGDVATSIDPAVGATITVANALTSWKGRWLACIATVSGNQNLYISPDAGATWTLIGGSNGVAGGQSVRVRRLASLPGQLIVACGTNGIKYYSGSGTSLANKSAPTGEHRSWEMFG